MITHKEISNTMRSVDIVLITNDVITQNGMIISDAGTENICIIAK